MKSIKIMLTGIMSVLIGTFFAAADNGRGEFVGFALILLAVGIIVFIIGLLQNSDWTKKF